LQQHFLFPSESERQTAENDPDARMRPGDLVAYSDDLDLHPDYAGFCGIIIRHVGYKEIGLILWRDGRQSIEMLNVLKHL
jgi:hypothetical protein